MLFVFAVTKDLNVCHTTVSTFTLLSLGKDFFQSYLAPHLDPLIIDNLIT